MGRDDRDEGTTAGLDADDLLCVTSRRLPAAIVVAAAGEIDLSTVEDFAVAIRAALTSRPGVVVVDLTEVEFLASTGLSVLMEAEQIAGDSGQRLRLVAGAHRVVARSLEMSGLADHFTICGSLEAALQVA